MAEINLLQNKTRNSSLANFGGVLVARILMVVLILIVAGYGYLLFNDWQTKKNIARTKAAMAQAQAEALGNKNRNELLTRQGQVKELSSLINDHVYWSYILPELARVTLKSAKYTAIEADSTGKLTLSVSLASYDDLEKYMQIFDLPEYNQQFSNVKILSLVKNEKEGSVETIARLQLTFNPAYIKGRLQ